MAFAEGDWEDPRLTVAPVSTSRVGIVAPTHLQEQLPDNDWQSLSQAPWALQAAGCSHTRLLEHLCRDAAVSVEPTYRTGSFAAVRELVLGGVAVSMADLDDVQPGLQRGDIFVWGDFEHHLPLSLLCLSARREEPAIAAVFDHLSRVYS